MSNIATLKSNEPGKRYAGRKAGVQNLFTRTMRTAMFLAAEESKHSSDGSLRSYLKFLADEKPELFAPMLARMIPIQAAVKHEHVHAEDIKLDASMNLTEMISAFEQKIKDVSYIPRPPRVIEHDDADD